MAEAQPGLFDEPADWPPGLRYEVEFLSPHEEASLLDQITRLPLEEMQYRQFTARRRIVTYGGKYDFSTLELKPAPDLPGWLHPLRQRAAAWAGLSPDTIHHALVAEYRPGTPLGWHRDVPDFEAIVGVSLGGPARMRFRRYPPRPPAGGSAARAAFHIDLAPRSIYTLQGEARWGWQHSVSPTRALRYSITFRTRR